MFHVQEVGVQVLLNSWEILVKEFFFSKISNLRPETAIKLKFITGTFQEFCLIFRDN